MEKAAHLVRLSLVGVARFELAALRSRTVRATKLRYTPIVVFSCFVSFLKQECFLMFGSASRAHRRFCCRAVRSAFLPMSRCIVFSLPLPYATQTALHPDSGYSVVLFHSSNRNVPLCLVARLALTEGFAAVQSARHSCPCRDASSFRCRCLMQPKLRYTPIVVARCRPAFLTEC